MYADSLVRDGYKVITACDGQEALTLLRSETPDLILLDLIMPTMGGLEALAHIKADPRLKDVPVLILSNLGQDSDIQRGLSLGAVDYLIKNDARPADISLKISTLLRSRPAAPSSKAYMLYVRDHEGDADRLTIDAKLSRHFWCPACEVELALVLVPHANRDGWYDAHFECPSCGREF